MGNGADVMSGDITVHMGDDALRQIIGFQLVGQSQLAQLGSAIPVAADDPLAHTFMAEVVAAGAVPVALTGCEEQRQVAGMAGFHKAVFQSLGQRFGAGAADEAAGRDGVAILDHQCRFLSSNNTYFFHIANSSFIIHKNFKMSLRSMRRRAAWQVPGFYLFWKCFSLRFSINAPMPSF